jgi:single-strand DNA-binding protein
MRGVNKWIGIGNVGSDPEVRSMPNGNAVTSFSVAASEEWKDQSGEKQSRTEWTKVTCFGKLAEIVGEYVKKGSKVYVEGKLQTDKYDKDGQTHYTTKVIASTVQFLDSRGAERQDMQQGEPAKADQKTFPSNHDWDDWKDS